VSILDVENFLLDVLGLLNDPVLDLDEAIDGLLALLDVLVDGQTEPVVVLLALVHPLVELGDLLEQKLLLDLLEVA
jgi:hypothetical protein